MANLMGFKKVSKAPSPKGRSIYDPLLNEVRKAGGVYVLDTQDRKRANSLTTTIRHVVKARGYTDVQVRVVGTNVVVEKVVKKADQC